ncbi:MAG: hypothetical protein NZ937_07565 [Armatimonadetes bacterium]|nr:hypothetical protein [Armatimonadota bacterium]
MRIISFGRLLKNSVNLVVTNDFERLYSEKHYAKSFKLPTVIPSLQFNPTFT